MMLREERSLLVSLTTSAPSPEIEEPYDGRREQTHAVAYACMFMWAHAETKTQRAKENFL